MSGVGAARMQAQRPQDRQLLRMRRTWRESSDVARYFHRERGLPELETDDEEDMIPLKDSHSGQHAAKHTVPPGTKLEDRVVDEAVSGDDGLASVKLWFSDYLPSVSKGEARLWLLFVVALSGINFGVIKLIPSETFDGPTVMTVRWLVATLAMTPWILDIRKDTLKAGTETGLWLAAGYAVQQVCLSGGTSAGVAAFFASLSSVVCPFIEAATGKKLDRKAWMAAGMAVMGAAALELGGGVIPTGNDLFAVLQPLLFGVYLFRTEAAMHKFPKDAMGITSIQVLICAVTSALWNLASPNGDALTALANFDLAGNVVPLLALLWMGLMSSAFTLAAETVIVGKLSSSETALMFSTEPLWAAGIGAAFLGESFGLNGYIGGALSIAACLVRVVPDPLDRRVQRELRVACNDFFMQLQDRDGAWAAKKARRRRAIEDARLLEEARILAANGPQQ